MICHPDSRREAAAVIATKPASPLMMLDTPGTADYFGRHVCGSGMIIATDLKKFFDRIVLLARHSSMRRISKHFSTGLSDLRAIRKGHHFRPSWSVEKKQSKKALFRRCTVRKADFHHIFIHRSDCCCCSHINSHCQDRGHSTGSSHSGVEDYPSGKTQTKSGHIS